MNTKKSNRFSPEVRECALRLAQSGTELRPCQTGPSPDSRASAIDLPVRVPYPFNLGLVVCLSLCRRDVLDGFEQSGVVEPVHPLQGGKFYGLPRFPGCPAVNQLGLVQPVDGLSQGVVVAVATAADRRVDAGPSQAFGVPNGNVLGAPIGMMNQLV
jgi:hypothetical protein